MENYGYGHQEVAEKSTNSFSFCSAYKRPDFFFYERFLCVFPPTFQVPRATNKGGGIKRLGSSYQFLLFFCYFFEVAAQYSVLPYLSSLSPEHKNKKKKTPPFVPFRQNIAIFFVLLSTRAERREVGKVPLSVGECLKEGVALVGGQLTLLVLLSL